VVRLDPGQIAFATGHYQPLRDGTTRAVLAASLLCFAGIFEYFSPAPDVVILVVAIGLIFGPLGLSRWLDRRFGVVRVGQRYRFRWDVDLAVPIWLVAIFLDSQARGDGRPSIAFLALAAYGLWLVVKRWPHGSHNLLPTIAALVVAFGFVDVQSDASLEQWEMGGLALTLAAWIIAGLFDFAVLTKLLPSAGGANAAE
jgi:hypothetical protein